MRRTKFTPQVVALIPQLVEDGKSPAEIAKHIGCKVGTLRVRCSQFKISLRRNPPDQVEQSQQASRLTVSLSSMAVDRLRQQAEISGTSESKFAAALLEEIARGNLYNAVLDQD